MSQALKDEFLEGELPPLLQVCRRKYVFGWELLDDEFFERYHPEKQHDWATYPWFKEHVTIPGFAEQKLPDHARILEPVVLLTGYDRVIRLILTTNGRQVAMDATKDQDLVSSIMKVLGIKAPRPRWFGIRMKCGLKEQELLQIQFDPGKTFN